MTQETINLITQFVNGVGFPIVTCAALAYYIVWDRKQRREDNKERFEEQTKLFDSLKLAIDNQTTAMQELRDLIMKWGNQSGNQ